MAHARAEIDGPRTRRWTEEQHALYLTRLEDSFVRRMLRFDSGDLTFFRRLSRLRCWLDDCACDRGEDDHASGIDQGMGDVTERKDKTKKHYDEQQDQVVPQLGSSVSDLIKDSNSNAEVSSPISSQPSDPKRKRSRTGKSSKLRAL